VDRTVDRQVHVIPDAGGVCLDVGRERLAVRLGAAREPRVGVGVVPGLTPASGGTDAAGLTTASGVVGLGSRGHDAAAGGALGGLRGPAWGAGRSRGLEDGPGGGAAGVRGGAGGGEDATGASVGAAARACRGAGGSENHALGWGCGSSGRAVDVGGGAVGGEDRSRGLGRVPGGLDAEAGGGSSDGEDPISVADCVATQGSAGGLGHANRQSALEGRGSSCVGEGGGLCSQGPGRSDGDGLAIKKGGSV
jgi:hypothetical protein